MPTYTVTAATSRLSTAEKQELVRRISQIHSQEGGNVPEFLVQVVFNELQPGNHFINVGLIERSGSHLFNMTNSSCFMSLQKQLVPHDQVWINGLIRAGRSDAQKTAMVTRLMNECAEAVGVDRSYVWAYISDLEKTAEFGAVLPAPGKEKEWVEAIPKEVRDRYGLY